MPDMSFFENIAAALDAEGIESRVNDDIMFVPITADLEIQFVEISINRFPPRMSTLQQLMSTKTTKTLKQF